MTQQLNQCYDRPLRETGYDQFGVIMHLDKRINVLINALNRFFDLILIRYLQVSDFLIEPSTNKLTSNLRKMTPLGFQRDGSDSNLIEL